MFLRMISIVKAQLGGSARNLNSVEPRRRKSIRAMLKIIGMMSESKVFRRTATLPQCIVTKSVVAHLHLNTFLHVTDCELEMLAGIFP
jgi:hypothetical protein